MSCSTSWATTPRPDVGHPSVVELHTDRIVLRSWRPEDRAPFAALNADPVVMEFFPSTATTAESDDFADRIEAGFAERGWGLWAVDVRGVEGVAGFVGYVGLTPVPDDLPPAPAVEVGWRLARPAWGHGIATEAAAAALRFAFDGLGLDEVVSFTSVPNLRSQGVMRRIGLVPRPERDFDHPRVDPASPLHRHVVYALTAAEWREAQGAGAG